MKWYHTTHMEDALAALAQKYRHVVLRRIYENAHFIPLRLNQVKGIDWYFHSPGFKGSQRDRWLEKGGVLINTHHSANKHDPIGYHNALLLPECPLSLYRIEAESRDTADCIVIYKPPSWREHELQLTRNVQPVEQVRTVHDWLLTQGGWITDNELIAATKITCAPGPLRGLLHRFARLYHYVRIPIRTRFMPENFEEARLYKWLQNQPISTGNGYRHVPEKDLITYSVHWRRLLNTLKRQAAIEKGELLYHYELPEDYVVNWELVGRDYRIRRSEWDQVRDRLEAAPEFPHRQILSGQPVSI